MRSVLEERDMQKIDPADRQERWPIDRLIPYARNARTHSEAQIAQIAASMQEFTGKIAVHAETGEPFAKVKDGSTETHN